MKLSTLALFIAAFALIALVMPVVHAQDAPMVTISNYQVNPSVLMPDTKGDHHDHGEEHCIECLGQREVRAALSGYLCRCQDNGHQREP